jgi:V8-like Glu-specific endopeptidase
MTGEEDFLKDFSMEELKSELVARGAQLPGEKRFKLRVWPGRPISEVIIKGVDELARKIPSLSSHPLLKKISMEKLVKALMFRADEMGIESNRDIWGFDGRKDIYEVEDEQIKANAGCVAAICKKNKLSEEKKGFTILKVKSFQDAQKVTDSERFCHQPTYAGWIATGFLVDKDVIATAAHCVKKDELDDLRFIFGYKMLNADTALTEIPNEQVYKGVEIIDRYYSREGIQPDWALVRLDRKVKRQAIAKLSREDIFLGLPVYAIGHPLGLPLKAAPGAYVCDVNETCFVADLDIFSGNSGSPVFRSDTGEVIGIVVRGDRDLKSTPGGWTSVVYPNFEIPAKGPQCTLISKAMIDHL